MGTTSAGRALLSVLCLALCLCLPAAAHAEELLILHSYHQGLSWTDELNEGLMSSLELGDEWNVGVIHLDSKRRPFSEVEPEIAALLAARQKRHRPSLIVATDNNALAFVREHEADLFAGVPVVFCGINGFKPDLIGSREQYTGVVERTWPAKTVDLMLDLQPKLERCIVLGDTTPTGQAERKLLQETLGSEYRGVTVEYRVLGQLDELLASLGSLDAERDAVLMTVLNRDDRGRFFAYETTGRGVADATAAPVYGLWDFYLQTGVLGGHMVGARDQGEAAGSLVNRIAAGASPASIPIQMRTPSRRVLAATAMRRAGMSFADLPPDIEVRVGQETVYRSSEHARLLRLGVLAPRGKAAAVERWQPLVNHLSSELKGMRVALVPLAFQEVEPAVADQQVDLLLADPAMYVRLDSGYSLSPLATLVNRSVDYERAELGSVVFVRADNPAIADYKDLRGRKFAAVHPESLGGWLASLRELETLGVAPSVGLGRVAFLGDSDSVVQAVAQGEAEVGIVRSNALEAMEEAGLIDVDHFRVIMLPNAAPFGLANSTQLYPEWPIVRLSHLSDATAEHVALALFALSHEESQIPGHHDEWCLPRSYKPVHDCLHDLALPPYTDTMGLRLRTVIAAYWRWLLVLLAGVLLLVAAALILARMNRLIRRTAHSLARSRERLSATLRSIGDGVISTDAEGRVVDINRVAEQLTGWSLDEARGMPVEHVFSTIDYVTRQAAGNPVRRSLRMGGPAQSADGVVLIGRGGTERRIADTCAPIHDSAGHTVGAVLVFRDITAEHEQRRALRESQSRVDELSKQSRTVVWEVDTQGRFTYVSWVAEAVFGRRPEELVGKWSLADLHPEEGRPAFREALQGRLRRHEPFQHLEHAACTAEGHALVIASNGIPIVDATGRFVGYRGSCTDITERKRTEEALREREALLRTLFDTLPDLVWFKSPVGKYLACNGRFEQLVGRSESEIVGKTAEDLFEPAVAHAILAEDKAALRTRTACVKEERLTFAADQHVEVVESVRMPICGPAGELLGVVGVGRDITERKRTEEELRKLSQAVEQMASSVIITDPTGVIEYVNPAFAEITGYSREEIVGENARILQCPDTPARVTRDVKRALTSGQTWRGELRHRRRDGSRFWELVTIAPVKAEAGETTHFVAVKDDISARKAMEGRLLAAARTDALTGLANRKFFCDRVEELRESDERGGADPFAILFLDFDRFKTTNDNLGHDIGDLLLKKIAVRLQEAVASAESLSPGIKSDTVARFGGDEFVVLLTCLQDARDAELVADCILEHLARPYQLAGYEIHSTASVGIVISQPCDQEATSDLLRDADTAMYEAKLSGKGCYRRFDESMRRSQQRRLALETELRTAVERDQFFFLYQPVVSLVSQKIDRYEALMCWQHPEFGPIATAEFMHVAEEAGLTHEIGEWGLERLCRQFVDWTETASGAPPEVVSMNLSSRQFGMPGLVGSLEQTLLRTGMPPESLELEISEATILEDIPAAMETLTRLKAIGVRLAMDNFGAGQSSLACLRRLPLDVLKIDRTFIDTLEQGRDFMALVQAVVSLAHNLGMDVVAQGVETVEQLAALQSLDCDFGEGSLFGNPFNADDVASIDHSADGADLAA